MPPLEDSLMPILQQPGASKILVSVPVPQPVVQTPRQAAPAPTQPVQQPSDESLFHQVASPPVLLLPHGPVAKQSKQPMQQRRTGTPAKLAYRAPAGGFVSRGVFYPGGQIIPDMALQTPKQVPQKLEAKQKKESGISRLSSMFIKNVKNADR
jgi:hypothetical protein